MCKKFSKHNIYNVNLSQLPLHKTGLKCCIAQIPVAFSTNKQTNKQTNRLISMCLDNNWKREHTSSASSASSSSSPCVLRKEITLSSSSSSSEYSDSDSSTCSSYLGVCACEDEHQYTNTTPMSLTPVRTKTPFVQLNGQ